MARALGVRFIFVEKEDNALKLRRFKIKKGERFVIAEDVVPGNTRDIEHLADLGEVGNFSLDRWSGIDEVTQFDDKARAAWEANEAMIKKLARVVSLDQVESFPKGCASVAAPGASFGLPLADIIDVDAEKARLEKNLGKLAKELGGLRGRLKNPKFVASAPDEVVAEARENLALREEEEAKLQDALSRLQEIE